MQSIVVSVRMVAVVSKSTATLMRMSSAARNCMNQSRLVLSAVTTSKFFSERRTNVFT